tara:strand:- start:650 stop:754 length:105 start_codon:yes stop_codon:yes gene_type:complete
MVAGKAVRENSVLLNAKAITAVTTVWVGIALKVV